MSVDFLGLSASPVQGAVQVVDVSTPTRADKRRLQTLGLDLTEHGDADSIEVVLYGNEDAQTLRDAKFRYSVRIADLDARVEANRRADRRFAARAAQNGGSRLPSGRTSYRRLPDYEANLKNLALRYPKLVRPFTLPYRTHLGRDVMGIEIATDVYNLRDGKPIFLNMGVHHAREWPSSEHAIEWAYDLLTNYGSSGRTTRLVRATRNIVVPIVNPDGFNISREAPDFPPETEFGAFSYEMKRKNCWPNPRFPRQPCDNNEDIGRLQGVDPNRNYGGFWGGSGASTNPISDTFRGTGPFSEPETQNIRWLQSERMVTNLITNHTYSNLVLRPPGVADTRPPLEEPLLEQLGARMTSHNDYANIPGYGLYDTTGSTEDWTFWSAGSIGYTFEIGPNEFHPPYQTGVVAEYLGLAPAEGAGQGGNREAYYEMLESTANRRHHSLITGRAPDGWTLKLHKSFMTATSAGVEQRLRHRHRERPAVPRRARLRVPLRRRALRVARQPVHAAGCGRAAGTRPGGRAAEPDRSGQPGGHPGGEHRLLPQGPYESIPFTVGGPPEVDNGRMTVHIEWGNPETDWDVYVVDSEGTVVSQSASFGDTTEDAVLIDPPPGEYTAHVVNYDQVQDPPDDWTNGNVTFQSPQPTTYGPREAWTLSCEDEEGRLQATRNVFVDRGGQIDVGRVCSGAFSARAQKRG